ncbi:MAG: hypothetical protein D6784_09020 [Chloroflexi bacterium]|nr:MAG: hypothetical protein D6784_09020 [Chloroflexota bacterium]
MQSNPAPHSSNGQSRLMFGLALVIVLVIGAALGYLFSRTAAQPVQVVVTATPVPTQAAQTAEQPAAPAAETGTATGTSAPAPTPSLMDLVLSDARHFQGQDDALVTLVEFSDFK